MLVSHRHRFAYLRPPRTASGSLSKFLGPRTMFGGTGVKGSFPHQTVWKPAFEGYFTFISVRCPFTRMVSLWKLFTSPTTKLEKWISELCRDNGTISFRQFVSHPRLGEELRKRACYCYEEGVPSLDAVVRYESLNEDLRQLPFISGKAKLGKKHISSYDKPWYEEYDEEICERVRDLWADDFRAYGYSFELEDAIRGG